MECSLKLISLNTIIASNFSQLNQYLRIIGYEIAVAARIYSRTMDDKYLRYCYFIVIYTWAGKGHGGRPSISRAQTTPFRIAFGSFLYRENSKGIRCEKWS